MTQTRLGPELGAPEFDTTAALDDLLADVGLSAADAGGRVSFAGADPIIPARHRLGAAIGIPMMGNAVAAAVMHRRRGGPGQDLHLDLRQAVHHINPSYAWEPTLAGEFPSIALVLDNPFALSPYRTRDGRVVMASAVYPHQAANWCRFLDVAPDFGKVARAIAGWDALALEHAANAAGLSACVARSPEEWLSHPQGALLASQPVIGLTRIGDAPPRELGAHERPFGGVRVLSFTHAVAGPTVGRVLAEQGADVLGATRPNDFEHDWVYFEANIGSRSAWLDLTKAKGRADVDRLLRDAHVVVNNHRDFKAVTAARRWRRLVSTGRAWVSSAVGPQLPVRAAVFEAECEPGAAQSVATELAARPHVFSVNITTGQHNLYALLVAADQPLLSELVVEALPSIPGLRRAQSALITDLFSGTRWRLGGLSPDQVRTVTPQHTRTAPAHEFDEFDRELFLALQRDGRLNSRDLAAAVDRSEPAVRRRMGLLTRSGLLAFRTDFARVEAGWTSAVALKLHVDWPRVSAVGRALVHYPETRFCVAIVGGAGNLFVTMQLHHASALEGVLQRLLTECPGVAVLDARVVLRSVKSWGRLLGPDGRAREIVPVDP